jgi:hypothetical protein
VEFDGAGEVRQRARVGAEAGAQPDRTGGPTAERALQSSQLVLAGRKEKRVGGDLLARIEPHRAAIRGLDREAAPHLRAGRSGMIQQNSIERAARQARRRAWQRGFGHAAARHEPQSADRVRAQGRRIDAQPPQRRQRIPAEEAAADHVLRSGLALDQLGSDAALRQPDRRRRSRRAAADDQGGDLPHRHAARSKRKPSAARPGPKAIATPVSASPCFKRSRSTNIRVEEDILP